MFAYRISTNETFIQKIGKGTKWSANRAPTPTASGKLFLLQGQTLDRALESPIQSLDLNSFSEHSSVGATASGQDALYQVAFGASPDGCNNDPDKGVGHLVEHNLETGGCRNIISQQYGYPYPTSSTHISALSNKRAGLSLIHI